MKNEDENINTRSLDDLSNIDDNYSSTTQADLDAFFKDQLDNTKEPVESEENDIFSNLLLDDEDNSLLESSKEEEIKEENSSDVEQPRPKKTKKLRKPLTKKQKIILIVTGCLLLIIIISLIIYLVLPKKEEKTPEEPKNTITIDNGNYQYQDGTLIFLNDQKTQIGTYECQEKNETLCYVAYLDNDLDDVNTTKNTYEDNSAVKFRSQIFHNRYVFLKDGSETLKLYDILENKTTNEYKSLKYYETLGSDYVILKNNDNKYGLVEITSNETKTIIDFTYDNLTSLSKKDNILIAKKNNKSYLINLNNKVLTKSTSKDIYDYNDKYLVLKDNNNYSLINYNNETIYENYNYIGLVNDTYVSLVSDGYVYIRDYEKNKYNEVGFNLYNSNYSGLNVYDKDGVEKSNSYAYKTTINNDTMTIFIKNNNDTEEKSLNLRDGAVSKNIAYYSNFDGILYFYSDLEKNNSLGSYPCTNKNDLTNSDTLSNCKIASNYSFDDNFQNNNNGLLESEILPIVDNRYVFINDDMNGSDGEAKVYDLYKKTTLATYKHISVNTHNNTLEFVSKVDNIIVKNKSDKFGVINVDSNGITKTYDFVYDRMERLGDYIEVSKNNKYQILFNSDSSSISLSSKIYDFSGKYFVVKNNESFDIYSDEGSDNPKKITDKSYKVIKLVGESLYLGIDSTNKVHVMMYDNKEITSEEITLPEETNIYKLYNMVSCSISGNNIILNTYNASGEKIKTYTLTYPSKDNSSKDNSSIKDIIGEIFNATKE